MKTIIALSIISILTSILSYKDVKAATNIDNDINVMAAMCTMTVDQVNVLTNSRIKDEPFSVALANLTMPIEEKEAISYELQVFYDTTFKGIANYKGGINTRWLNYYTACTEHFNQ